MNILPGMALSPVDNASLILMNTSKVLRVIPSEDVITLIEISPRKSAGRMYFTAPINFKLSHIQNELDANAICCHKNGIGLRPDVRSSDDELNKKYGESPCKSVQIRRMRFSVIKHLVDSVQDYPLFYDGHTRNALIDSHLNDVKLKGMSKPEVQQIVFQFLAEGATPNALTPLLALRGGRGKQREQKKKIGRPNAPTKAGQAGFEGFVMSEEDKKKCGWAFRHYLLKGKTLGFAHRKMLREYYSEPITNEHGKIDRVVYPSHQCPSIAQFKRWGESHSNQNVWQKQFNEQQLARLNRALLGKQSDEILMVGQLAAIDSTSVDTEFVSVKNRLVRIGSAHRILLVDATYGYISGFYMGIDAPSHVTVGLGILHAASDKTEWIEELGLSDEMSAEDWIPMQFGRFNADNTDLRNAITMSKFESLGIGISFVPVSRSDFNSLVETKHKTLHRLVDHNMPGTTRGKKLVRGDEKPDVFARMTIVEGMRETARAIHFYNTVPIDIPITLEIQRELVDKGLTVNRLNLTRMIMNSGRVHSSILDIDELMCKFGVAATGTFTAEGVKLHRTRNLKREFYDRVRYVSTEPKMLEWFKEAKVNRRGSPLGFDATFYHNPYSPRNIYYPDPHTGIIYRLELVSPETEIDEFTFPDLDAAMEQDAEYQYHADSVKQQKRCALEEKQEQSEKMADAEYKKALANSPPIPKSRISKNKKENRVRERAISLNGIPEAGRSMESEADHPIQPLQPNLKPNEDTSFLDSFILEGKK